ncbi:MAG: 3-hydroxyacyl-CoA dehydrogenase family protein [Candidatus Bathyarchaeia archaeon]
MKILEIKRVAVIGAGVMGSGIAYICAARNYEVSVVEVNEELLAKGVKRIREMIVEGVNRGKLTPREAEETMKRVKGTTSIAEAAKDADIVIEAVYEDMNVKKEVFQKLDQACPSHTILASNTSALSITEMASATRRPSRVIGLHFFNPPYAMKLVEVVLGAQTSEETRRIAEDFVRALGKETVTVKDSPGFIVNRIVLPMLNEAAYLVYEGKASMEDVDKAATLGMNFPAGPFRVADLVGLDIALAVLENLHKAFGEKFKPCPLLVEKVKAGHLGLKTRKGFYEY